MLSWKLDGDGRRGVPQAAYQLQLWSESDERPLWDTGRESRTSIGVRYEGPPLASRRRYRWRVGVWDEQGGASAWSQEAGGGRWGCSSRRTGPPD